MSVMDDAVENGVGEGRFADQIVPAVDRDRLVISVAPRP